MNLNFKSKNTKLTEADQEFIEEKLTGLGRLVKPEDKVFVEAEVDAKHKSGLIFRLEVTINPPQFYADARGNDFYEALDLVLPKIKEQLAKQKDKKVSLRRRKTSLKNLK